MQTIRAESEEMKENLRATQLKLANAEQKLITQGEELAKLVQEKTSLSQKLHAVEKQHKDAEGSILALREQINSMQQLLTEKTADDAAMKKLLEENAKMSQTAKGQEDRIAELNKKI